MITLFGLENLGQSSLLGGGNAAAPPATQSKRCQEAQDHLRTGLCKFASLRATSFPTQISRDSVTAKAGTFPEGVSVGMNLSTGSGYSLTRSNMERYCELIKGLCQLATVVNPKFSVTTIQIHKSFATALHCNSSYLGPSLVTCTGSISGGALYIHGKCRVSVKERFYEFDGDIPHLSCPFKAKCFSIIYLVNHGHAQLPARDISYLKTFSFNWPKPGLKKLDYRPWAVRLPAEAAAMPPELAGCIGPLGRMCQSKSLNDK